jgi:hypothetical protein
MAICEVEGMKINCGEGHGCAVICTTHEKTKTCWSGCGSKVIYFIDNELLNLPPHTKFTFQCNNIKMGSLRKALNVIEPNLVVPKGQSFARITINKFEGTLEEIFAHIKMERKPSRIK